MEVEMFGLPADTVRKKFKTKVVPGNGMNPIYNEDAFPFKKVHLDASKYAYNRHTLLNEHL